MTAPAGSFSVREITPPGRGGVSILRVAGAGARERVRRIVPAGLPPAGGFRLVRLAVGDEALDEALVLVAAEDEIEVHLHASPPLVRRLLSELGGAREDGGSVEELALELAARAGGEAAARMLLDQASGALRRELERLVRCDPWAFRIGLERLLARACVARTLVRPPRLVLAGTANSGKSTLFNVLVGRERVVTSAESGTTRDLIEERVLVGAYEVVLVDTAGDRCLDPTGPRAGLELRGQALARSERESADLVLWLQPADASDPIPPCVGACVVASMADRLPPGLRERTPNALSAREDPAGARRVVEVLFLAALDLPEEPWTPEAAVPFTPELEAGLREMAKSTSTRERRRVLSRLLDGRR